MNEFKWRTILTVRVSVLRVWFALARAHRHCHCHCHCHCVGPQAARRGARVGPRNACGVRAFGGGERRGRARGSDETVEECAREVGRPIGDKSVSHLAISSQTKRKCVLLPSKCRHVTITQVLAPSPCRLPRLSYVLHRIGLLGVWAARDCCRVSAARWRGAGGCAAPTVIGRKPLRDFFASARRVCADRLKR
jgi:hypothetical protein